MVNGVGIEFVWLTGGTFRMGHPEHRKPVHPVRVDGFWMSRYEITNVQFEQFRKRSRSPASPGDRYPVCGVSRDDAEAFAQWLSKREGRKYRLPTEAEWEYAARGGLEVKEFPWGDDIWKTRATIGGLKATRVGTYEPNGFGLYDMAGNVSEWVQDTDLEFPPSVKINVTDVNPCYMSEKNSWLSRGGSFVDWSAFVYYAAPEIPGKPSERYTANGIRLVIDEAHPLKVP